MFLFPLLVLSSILTAAIAIYLFYTRILYLQPSKCPRKSFGDSAARAKTYPPPFPNTWYHLCDSEDVLKNGVHYVEGMGRKYAVWRNESGKLNVFDAICPHNGANLATGKVVDGCLECPFHHIRFAPDGQPSRIPWLDGDVTDVVRKSHHGKVYHHEERWGMVFVWFDAEDAEPRFPMPDEPKIEKMQYCSRWESDRLISMHVAEYVENTVDIRHFDPMHGKMALPWTRIRLPIDVKFKPGVKFDGPHLYFTNESSLVIKGWDVPRSSASVVVDFCGPACYRFLFSIPNLGDICMFQTYLPQSSDHGLSQRVRVRWMCDSSVPKAVAWYVCGEWVSNWWEDVLVWEEKIRKTPPALLKGDGPIASARRWLNQFYTENSEMVAQNPNLDW